VFKALILCFQTRTTPPIIPRCPHPCPSGGPSRHAWVSLVPADSRAVRHGGPGGGRQRPSGPPVHAAASAAGGPPSPLGRASGPWIRPKAAQFARARGQAAQWALSDADRPRWRPSAAIGGPRRVLVRVAATRGGMHRRPWTTLAAPGFGHRLSGSLGHAGGQLCGLRTTRISPDGDQEWPPGPASGALASAASSCGDRRRDLGRWRPPRRAAGCADRLGAWAARYAGTDLTRNTRAPHFTPQHWLLCHMGLY